jgi:phage tail sheath protein FI
MPQTINTQALPPGFYAFEQTAGRLPAQIADFSRAYLLVSGSTGEYLEPTQVVNEQDAVDKFGVAGVDRFSIANLFTHNPRAILSLVRVPTGQVEQVGVAVADDSATYTLEIDGITVEYEATLGDTEDEIAAGLIASVNDSEDLHQDFQATAYSETNKTFEVRALNPTNEPTSFTVSATGTGELTTTTLTSSQPRLSDYVYAVNNSFDDELHRPGFLAAPTGFMELDDEDRHALGSLLLNYATEYDWFAVIDPDPDADTVEKLIADRSEYDTPRGHGAYYAPYIYDFNDNLLPPSSYAIGTALSRYEREGFYQPPAGAKYPLRNVRKLLFKINSQQHAVLNNDHNINVIKRIQGGGYQIRGARTLTTNPFFTSITDRIIFNVILESLRLTYRNQVFESLGRPEEFFRAIRRAAISLLNRFWKAGALFGNIPSQAFEVICDRSNNSDEDLEASIVNLTIYAVPSPTVEKLIANVNRVAIGEVEIFAGGGANQQIEAGTEA